MAIGFESSARPAGKAGVVREHEILRISAMLGGGDAAVAAENARREVLAWASNRSGGRLPKEAWGLQSFDYLSGGRNSSAIRFTSDAADIWALRAEDPDRTVPGRIWTTEVVTALSEGVRPRLSIRLMAHTAESELLIEPHSPGFVQQIADACGLYRSGYEFSADPSLVLNESDAEILCQSLVDPDRPIPIFVLSLPEGGESIEKALLDARSLARATLGIASVVVAAPAATWVLTNRFGQSRSVHSGAVRAYMPGFSGGANPYDHRLVISSGLQNKDHASQVERWMRSIAARESVRRNRIGQDIITFGAIRSLSLKARQEVLSTAGAGLDEMLQAVRAQVAALENDLDREKAAQEYFALEADKAEERAQAAEAQHRASSFFIQHLQKKLAEKGDVAEETSLPSSWVDFSNWCDTELAGRVSLAPAARRNSRSPQFEDVGAAARSLVWLAGPYRDGRINGSSGDFVDFPIEEGIRNSACGGDEFDFMWQGRRYTADWHIKNGGNTRDPRLCLRIYYFWDAESHQVVVADMPAHRDTSAS